MGAFSVFNDKRSQKNKKKVPTVREHYEKLARRTAVIRYTCLILVAVFAVWSFAFHGSELSVENFRYMLKFINLKEEEEAPEGNTINFDGNEGNRGIIFKSDLAVLNEGGLTITGWDGNVTLKSSFQCDHPKMIENGNYLFCYDIGGKEIRIFNSYSQVWSSGDEYEYPIYWVAAAKAGGFAVVSSAKGYRSAVYVYDGEFRQIYSRLFGDKYVDFVDISEDGKEFITAAHYSESGNVVTVVSRFSVTEEDPVHVETFIGEVPIGIYYTEEGYALMTSDALRFFGNADKDSKQKADDILSEISFSGKNLLSGKIYKNSALLTYRLDGLAGGTELDVYDTDGNIIFTREYGTSLTDAVICGEKVYTLSPGKIAECDIKNEREDEIYEIPTSFSTLIPDDDRIIIFSDSEADYFIKSEYERTAY